MSYELSDEPDNDLESMNKKLLFSFLAYFRSHFEISFIPLENSGFIRVLEGVMKNIFIKHRFARQFWKNVHQKITNSETVDLGVFALIHISMKKAKKS